MNKGFTLIELIIVIIIISILASLGYTQYSKTMEKGRTAEARAVLGSLRTAETTYNQQYGSYSTNLSNLDLVAPTSCSSTHYFSYAVDIDTGTATRCTANGKTPNVGDAYSVTLEYATGVWSGTAGYY